MLFARSTSTSALAQTSGTNRELFGVTATLAAQPADIGLQGSSPKARVLGPCGGSRLSPHYALGYLQVRTRKRNVAEPRRR